ncbi:carboxypeptidase-like regulatory domain-containing protein [Flexithrix dorotheae]|uniref:carboxypeptidase-like regulatory domain-containing protein n=1 Tax=Flexithrix dorotheae TaxID=70993 RepID=UPI0005C57E31|nr:carboxypeptidase-like regulatory domain-containing protein [Flexithrix dorotheae]
MNKTQIRSALIILLTTLMIISCNKKEDPNPNGFANGKITSLISNEGLAEVSITVFNANTNEPVTTTKSDVEGNFQLELLANSYYLRLSKQGYEDIPPLNMSPIPFDIIQGMTENMSYQMTTLDDQNMGWVSGQVLDGDSKVTGALVVIQAEDKAYSSISDHEGNFVINNVKAGNYTATAWIKGYNSIAKTVLVISAQETFDNNIIMTKDGNGSFNGQIRNLASSNKDVDISLIHPITRQPIPFLSTSSVAQNFEITGIPNGTFIARATFENDERVMDPDRIAKFGEPVIEINNDEETLTFDITGSIELGTPTNESTTVVPVEVNTTSPVLEWNSYSSTTDYIIEVSDMNGNIIWGGFSEDSEGLPIKNISIPSSQTSIEYNSDGKASLAQLEPGKIYRWRIYASKKDQNSPTGWSLISASEDQRGLIKIAGGI